MATLRELLAARVVGIARRAAEPLLGRLRPLPEPAAPVVPNPPPRPPAARPAPPPDARPVEPVLPPPPAAAEPARPILPPRPPRARPARPPTRPPAAQPAHPVLPPPPPAAIPATPAVGLPGSVPEPEPTYPPDPRNPARAEPQDLLQQLSEVQVATAGLVERLRDLGYLEAAEAILNPPPPPTPRRPRKRRQPRLTVSPSLLDFGSIPAETDATQVLHLANTGNATLQISGFSLDPSTPFALVDAGATSLEPGEGTSATFLFAPTDPGNYTSSLDVASNDPNTPARVVLVGVATPPPEEPEPEEPEPEAPRYLLNGPAIHFGFFPIEEIWRRFERFWMDAGIGGPRDPNDSTIGYEGFARYGADAIALGANQSAASPGIRIPAEAMRGLNAFTRWAKENGFGAGMAITIDGLTPTPGAGPVGPMRPSDAAASRERQEDLRRAARRTETWFPTPEDRDAAERELAEYTPDPDQDDEDDE